MKKSLALALLAVISFSACSYAPSDVYQPTIGTSATTTTNQVEATAKNDFNASESNSSKVDEFATKAESLPKLSSAHLQTDSASFSTSALPSPTKQVSANINITIGGSVFLAKLYDNSAATALLEMLPLTLNFSELNGNEKYFYLPASLPADSEMVGDINTGDLMLYGSDCLVLFYKSFATSFSYTRLGAVEDATGLAHALGSGDVTISFSVAN